MNFMKKSSIYFNQIFNICLPFEIFYTFESLYFSNINNIFFYFLNLITMKQKFTFFLQNEHGIFPSHALWFFPWIVWNEECEYFGFYFFIFRLDITAIQTCNFLLFRFCVHKILLFTIFSSHFWAYDSLFIYVGWRKKSFTLLTLIQGQYWVYWSESKNF